MSSATQVLKRSSESVLKAGVWDADSKVHATAKEVS